MSDEEKKVIERLNKRYEFFKENPLATNVWLTLDIHDLGVVLNLIEKQSKEIEELKEKNKTLKNLQNDTNRLYIEMIERKNYFERELQKLEDKIKAKIEEYETTLNILLQKNEWIEPSDTIRRNKFIHYIEFGQSLLEKE